MSALAILGALLLSAPASEAEGPVEGPTGCVSAWQATVVDTDTGEGVPDAQLTLRVERQKEPLKARTDDQGRVRVHGLCPGTIRVRAAKSEHSSAVMVVDVLGPLTLSRITLEPLHEHHSHRVVMVHDEGPESLAASEHLAGEELAKTRGDGLADSIESMAGVSTLRGTAGGMAKPVIRGQVGRRNLIVFDGIRHEGQKWGLDHAPEIDPYSAGRITVVKGAATTRYGPDAIGGAVLVDPRPLPRTPTLAGEVTAMGASNALGGGGSARVDHAPAGGRGIAWRVEGNATRTRAALTPDYPLDNTGTFTWNAGARVGYLSELADVEVGYHLMQMTAGICSCLQVSTPDEFADGFFQEPVNAHLYSAEFPIERPRQEIAHHLAMARTRVELGKAGELHATYSYQFNDRLEYDLVRDTISGPQLSFDLQTHNVDLDYEHATVDLGHGWALAGTLGGRVAHQLNEFEAANPLVPDYDQWAGGVFLIERFAHRYIEFEVGGRYEGLSRLAAMGERDFLGQRALGRLDEGACTRRDDGGADCRATFHTPSASAGVLARPLPRLYEFSARVEVNSSARIPAIDEQFMNGAAPSFPILGLGNSRLGIERTWGGSTTLRWDGDWLLAEASGYANYIDDYINFAPDPQEGQCAPLTCTSRGPLPVFAFESVDAFFGGGEVRVNVVMPRLPFEISGNAAWVRAQDLIDGSFLALVPSDRYGITGRYRWPDTKVSGRGYLEVSGNVVDRQRRFNPDTDFADPPPAYVLMGAGAGVEFPTQAALMRLSLRGTNLLNQRYREYTSLLRYFADEPGWALQLRFSVDFNAGLS